MQLQRGLIWDKSIVLDDSDRTRGLLKPNVWLHLEAFLQKYYYPSQDLELVKYRQSKRKGTYLLQDIQRLDPEVFIGRVQVLNDIVRRPVLDESFTSFLTPLRE